MTLQILKGNHKTLLTPAQDVIKFDSELESFAEQMKWTLLENNLIGLAANQVNSLQRVFVLNFGTGENPEIVAFVNPVVKPVKESGKKYNYEGCASLNPNLVYNVERWNVVDVTAKNVHGNEFSLRLDGLMARAVQHETDHLAGKLAILKSRGTRKV